MLIKEKNNTKYNNGCVMDISKLSNDELQKAIGEFSEGSESLKKCLEVLYSNHLYTKACCKGDHLYNGVNMGDALGEAYISMQPNIDVFSYLSKEFINSEFVELLLDNSGQIIYIYGKEKDELLYKLTNDILTGKKDNKEDLTKKINKDINTSVKVASFINRMEKNNVDLDTINRLVPIITEMINIDIEVRRENNLEKCEFLEQKSNKLIKDYNMILKTWIYNNNHDSLEDTQEIPVIK